MPAPSAARPPFLSPQQQRFTLVGEERLFHQSLFFFFLFAAAPPWRKQVEGRGGVSQLDLLPFCGGFSSYTSLGYLISDFFGTHDNHGIESWMLMFSYLKIFFAHLNFVRLLICQKRPFAPPPMWCLRFLEALLPKCTFEERWAKLLLQPLHPTAQYDRFPVRGCRRTTPPSTGKT